jgi:hypothetical protein
MFWIAAEAGLMGVLTQEKTMFRNYFFCSSLLDWAKSLESYPISMSFGAGRGFFQKEASTCYVKVEFFDLRLLPRPLKLDLRVRNL